MRMVLISMGQLDDEGYSTSFGKEGSKISKGALVVAKGPKIGTLYSLKAMVSDFLSQEKEIQQICGISVWVT